jgi:hypothetical protein
MPGLQPERVVIIDVDGLRADVYHQALEEGGLEHFARLVGPPDQPTAHHVPVLSVAPSITFAAQASIVTGAHPARHGVPGNECFDRLGRISDGVPRHFGFDIGDTLAVDDAVAVFSDGLADRLLNPDTPTIYESAAARGKSSLVAYHMYARGAQTVIRPDLVKIARFAKLTGRLGLEAGRYDAGMLDRLLGALRRADSKPDLIMVYFMGLDHHSHLHGPDTQASYLREVVDPQVGRLLDELAALNLFEGTLFVILSDHGQLATPGDDARTIRLGFPFGLDLHARPGEDPNVDAVVGLNGGLAQVYLRHRHGEWSAVPRFEQDVLPVAQAFHEMNETGKYRQELQGTLELILIRDAAGAGSWEVGYQAYLGDGQTQPLADWLRDHPGYPYADAANRLKWAASSMSGDLILAARAEEGYYFGKPGLKGVHGSLHRGDSAAVLTFALPSGSSAEVDWLHEGVDRVIGDRCAAEGDRQPSIADMAPVLRALWLEADRAD